MTGEDGAVHGHMDHRPSGAGPDLVCCLLPPKIIGRSHYCVAHEFQGTSRVGSQLNVLRVEPLSTSPQLLSDRASVPRSAQIAGVGASHLLGSARTAAIISLLCPIRRTPPYPGNAGYPKTP